MKMAFRYFMTLLLLILSTSSHGAQDPIAWIKKGNLPANTTVGDSISIVYEFTNNLPFTMLSALEIVKTRSTNEIKFVDNCTGKKLTPKQSCIVTVTFMPITEGKKSFKLTMRYGFDTVALPQLKTLTNTNAQTIVTGTVDDGLPTEMQLGGTPDPVTFAFANNGSAPATSVGINKSYPADFTQTTDTCTGTTLPPNSNCFISGNFSPNTLGPATISVTFNYAEGSPIILNTSTTVVNDADITGEIEEALPQPLELGKTYEVKFKYTNQDPTNQAITITKTYPAGFTETANTCTSPLMGNSSCNITGNLIPQSLGPITVAVNLNYSNGDVPLSTTSVVGPSILGREITFVNQCPFPVWFAFNGGSVQDGCASNNDCPNGSSCNPASAGGAGECFWNNPVPANGNFKLEANNDSNSVTIPLTNLANPFLWSGSISGRTGCNQTNSCETAGCGGAGGSQGCAVGVGFAQPSTAIEPTFLRQGVDSYDIEAINGFNIPMQFTPNGATVDNNQPYNCGSPGDPNPPAGSQFGPCTWQFTPPSNDYIRVTNENPPTVCTTDADCSGTQICGLTQEMNKQCGNFLGYWTANEVCGKQNPPAVFNCDDALPPPLQGLTLKQLYGCSPISGTTLNTCYNNNSTTACCGCANWDQEGAGVPAVPQFTEACVNMNQSWVTLVQPTLLWIKDACPALYTYPFDDKSSSFTCTSGQTPTDRNAQNYTVTFCPGGATGAPVLF